MTIQENRTDEGIELKVEGRIDAVSAPQLQQMILTSLAKASVLAVNIEKVDYVSSAGLRAFLIGQKTANSKGGRFTVRGVQPAVKYIFDTPGFTDILNLE